MRNLTMMTDFYELTMSQAYFKAGKKDEVAVFDAFFRKNPLGGGYGVMGGVDRIIDFIKNAHFNEEDINYLRSTGKFKEEFLEYLKNLKFTGDIFAIEDGTTIFPNEPVLTVRANVIEAQLIETALLLTNSLASLLLLAAPILISKSTILTPVLTSILLYDTNISSNSSLVKSLNSPVNKA